jgi:hypothetical protein
MLLRTLFTSKDQFNSLLAWIAATCGSPALIFQKPRRLSPDLVAARYALLEPRGEGVAFVEMSDSDYFAFLRRHTERPQKEEFHFPVRGPRLIVPAPNPLEG